ncbi:restriction endonuclease subunit S [Enterococcus faecalis]|uniref:restriction endonuclease subunit S n=1 Tax=Enterococcus faecalis TaxID=1351 RepID=UPI002FDC1ECB
MDTSLNEKLRSVEWGEYKIEDLFIVKTSKGYDAGKLNFISKSKETFEFIGRTQSDYGVQGYVLKLDSEPNDSGCISVSQIGAVHAQLRNKKWYSSQNIFILKPKIDKLINQWLIVAINKALSNFGGYSSYPTLSTLKKLTILLPINNEQIDFDFMDTFIAELEAERIAELSAYLTVSGLDNYELSVEELKALRDYDSLEWKEFNLEKLFGKSTRGKRLRSLDRISGDLPFVTAGETNTGISAYISNEVEIFKANTVTIDMFGSAKYRNYDYGADDHIAVVHTEKLNKFASLFTTAAIHKASYSGKFSYDKNFYAKDADELVIALPVDCQGVIQYDYMSLIASAIQKLVIKDVVKYTNERIETTKEVVTSHDTNY